MIKSMLYKPSISYLYLILLSLFACGRNEDTTPYRYLEMHREMALKEWISDTNSSRNTYEYFKQGRVDTNLSLLPREIREYLQEHRDLPGYIYNALIEGRAVVLMNIEEFILVKYKYRRVMIFIPDYLAGGVLITGNKEEYKDGLFRGGPIWKFRHGFLWWYGEI